MSLSRAEVEKVSLLGRLLLSDAELDTMTEQLGGILHYIELLGEVDTTASSRWPTRWSCRTSFATTCAAEPAARRGHANAPHRDDECYLVPAVLGVKCRYDSASAE